MKKNLSRNNSMKALRGILRMNQRQFARLLGVSVDTIGSIETGRIALTRKMNRKISEATAATLLNLWGLNNYGTLVPDGTVYKRCPAPQVLYTKEDWQSWSKRKTAQSVEEDLAWIVPMIRAIFHQAASSPKTKNRIPALKISLLEWFEDSCIHFQLSPFWNRHPSKSQPSPPSSPSNKPGHRKTLP
jgi:DNA-binding XRE family transcriptional regulator